MSKKASEVRKIRYSMGYTVRDFAELLGYRDTQFSTYQGYDAGTSPTPKHVLNEARAAQKRDKRFFKTMGSRVDEALQWRGVPNEAIKGEW